MSHDNSFRIHCRINRTEYEDLVSDLERFSGDDRNARVKMLLRAGLISITSRAAPIAGAPVQALPMGIQSSYQPAIGRVHESPAKAEPRNGADVFDSLGLDPANFSFGAAP